MNLSLVIERIADQVSISELADMHYLSFFLEKIKTRKDCLIKFCDVNSDKRKLKNYVPVKNEGKIVELRVRKTSDEVQVAARGDEDKSGLEIAMEIFEKL